MKFNKNDRVLVNWNDKDYLKRFGGKATLVRYASSGFDNEKLKAQVELDGLKGQLISIDEDMLTGI